MIECETAYSGDGVYLYSSKDDPESKDDMSTAMSSVLPLKVCYDHILLQFLIIISDCRQKMIRLSQKQPTNTIHRLLIYVV